MKPKRNYKNTGMDLCQTPPYALTPILPYLKKDQIIWECACGEGSLYQALIQSGHNVAGTDILGGIDFFEYDVGDVIVTNPPYSIKYDFMKRCYELGKPFALLMPVEMIGTAKAQSMFERYGYEWIFLDKRINFKMPHKGFNGNGAQFPVAWYCWKLVGQPVTFAKINREWMPEHA